MQKEIIKKVLKEKEESLIREELFEGFLQRQRLKGSKNIDIALGQVQEKIKFLKEYIEYIKEQIK